MPNPFDSILRAIGADGCMRLRESGRVRSGLHNLRMMFVGCPACVANTPERPDAHPAV
ncbi:hypothetical protein NDI43_15905 [Microcoleus vaginatus GB2-A3]|uniref:hypothetical protein n=1 Tax=Microcoleus vaginatus TaxID=119532 RepID=UPI0032AAA15A